MSLRSDDAEGSGQGGQAGSDGGASAAGSGGRGGAASGGSAGGSGRSSSAGGGGALGGRGNLGASGGEGGSGDESNGSGTAGRGEGGEAGSGGAPAGPVFAELEVDGFVVTRAFSVSVDGAFVAGEAAASGVLEAARWSGIRGESLGKLPDSTASSARAISNDGSVLIGTTNTAAGSSAFRWQGDWTELPPATRGSMYSEATAVSGDGTIAVGLSTTGDTMALLAVQWRGESVQALPLLAGDAYATPTGVSDDGGVICGTGKTLEGRNVAERWPAAGVASLGLPDSEAHAVSGDGRFVVGAYVPDLMPGMPLRIAFRWSASGVDFLSPPSSGDFDCVASAVNRDGSVVVGTCTKIVDQTVSYWPFLWSETAGTRSLAQVLAELGVDTSTLTLREITDVSADGRVIVGNAMRQGRDVAFRARVE